MNANTPKSFEKSLESSSEETAWDTLGKEVEAPIDQKTNFEKPEPADKAREQSKLFNKIRDLAKSANKLDDSSKEAKQEDDDPYSTYKDSVNLQLDGKFDKSNSVLTIRSGVASEVEDCGTLLFEKKSLEKEVHDYGKSIPGWSARKRLEKVKEQLGRYDKEIQSLAEQNERHPYFMTQSSMNRNPDFKRASISREINYAKILSAEDFPGVKKQLRKQGYKQLPISVDDKNFTSQELSHMARIAESVIMEASREKKK